MQVTGRGFNPKTSVVSRSLPAMVLEEQGGMISYVE
jgi:hypothetical protein